MNDMKPKVSIILPAYNAESTITETIQSIINQTYTNWELIVINDGSTDRTEQIIKSFQDKRIRYFANNKNLKLVYTLNRGIELALGKYIARMDADDICKSTRLETQVAFMESHSDVTICGTQIEYFGTKSTSYKKLVFPLEDRNLKDMLAMSTCFAHPTVIIRKSALDESKAKYDLTYKNAEDYSLWIDMMNTGKYANLSEKLLMYRISDNQISQPSNSQTIASVLKCKHKYACHFLSKELADALFEEPITIRTLREVRLQCRNRKIMEACYLSMNSYNLYLLMYYIISFDFIKLGIMPSLRIIKRFIKGKSPIYFNINHVS